MLVHHVLLLEELIDAVDFNLETINLFLLIDATGLQLHTGHLE
jgi:hypothetical protein